MSSVSASRQVNSLKNLLIFSCCLPRPEPTGGRASNYARCRDRGMPRQLKGRREEELKVIYAVHETKVPYVA